MFHYESEIWVSRNLSIPDHEVSTDWVLQHFSLPRRELRVLVKEGFVTPVEKEGQEFFDSSALKTIALVLVLRREMGVNLAGIEIILHLKKQIHWHLSRSHRRTGNPDWEDD